LTWVALDAKHVDVLSHNFDHALLGNHDVMERNEASSAVPHGPERSDQFTVTNNAEPVQVLQSGLIEPVLSSGFIVRRPHERVVNDVPPQYNAPLVRVTRMSPLRQRTTPHVIRDQEGFRGVRLPKERHPET
jgi:hypothetical protein